ncbi:MAG TPA: DUF2752 domain-containing protein [Gemmataceae bacterium]|jgi:hypothetical protein
MVPASWTHPDAGIDRPPLVVPVLTRRVRLAVVAVAAGLVVLFAVAAWLDPYGPDGLPRAMGTHTQLGLPECNFLRLTGLPCPSCGMTTSFALLMHGDVLSSLRVNPVGTLLALTLLAAIPWSLVGAVRGRWLWVRTLEPWLLKAVIVFTGLALLRWAVLLGMRRWGTG